MKLKILSFCITTYYKQEKKEPSKDFSLKPQSSVLDANLLWKTKRRILTSCTITKFLVAVKSDRNEQCHESSLITHQLLTRYWTNLPTELLTDETMPQPGSSYNSLFRKLGSSKIIYK